ncbi:MAG: hypothetical protein QF752_11425 [Planctomycetota bacterium]|jgi:hypothetical protein|nr:hypothetical protein [Planctomycetota bacterium]
MDMELEGIEGEAVGCHFTLESGKTLRMGGGEKGDPLFRDPTQPFRELTILDAGGALEFEEKRGLGVYVNDRYMSSGRLYPGDLILAGSSAFLVREISSDPHRAEMDEGGWSPLNGFPTFPVVEIPRLFHSAFREGPFLSCVMCSESLEGEIVEPYFIEKVYRGSEVVMECAICQSCVMGMGGEMSEESSDKIRDFSRENANRGSSLIHCGFCGNHRTHIREYNVFCGGVNRFAIPGSFCVLCEECVEGLQSLLSKKTQDVQKDFVDDHFPGVPADLGSPVPLFF